MRAHPAGFALPLALVIVLALALLESLLIEGAVARLRTSASSLSAAVAAAAAESALARTLATRFDSLAAMSGPGATLMAESAPPPDSLVLTVVVLQPGLARIHIAATTIRGPVRAIAGRTAYVEIVRDTTIPSESFVRPLPRLWWVGDP